ncbi:MAG: DUF2007 domain-containing protein [Bacteroidetes bacterium]|nr:DUF2007 domain-containing protein [Bacteroidota bacterium]
MNAIRNDLVPVRFYDDPLEAHLGRCLLQNEGIEAYVNDEHIIGLNRALGVAFGGVKLKVALTDKERALAILEETEQRPYLDEESKPVHCPQCGSVHLRSGISKPRTWSGALHLAIGFLLSVYPLSTERGMLCDNCSHFFLPPH